MSTDTNHKVETEGRQEAEGGQDRTNRWHWLVVGATERDKVRALLRFLSGTEKPVTIGISDWKRAAVLASLLGSLGLRARLTEKGLLVNLNRLGSDADATLLAFEEWSQANDSEHCVCFHLPFWRGEVLPSPTDGSAVALVTLSEMSFIKQHLPDEDELHDTEALDMDDITAEELVLAMARLAGELGSGRKEELHGLPDPSSGEPEA